MNTFENNTGSQEETPEPVQNQKDSQNGKNVFDSVENGPVALVPEDLESLIPGYMENRRKDIVRIRQLVKNGEFGEAQRLAHSMKGSGGGYGFEKITELGALMELAAESMDGTKILSGIDELEIYINTVRIEYVDDDN